jgi:RIO kinase 2
VIVLALLTGEDRFLTKGVNRMDLESILFYFQGRIKKSTSFLGPRSQFLCTQTIFGMKLDVNVLRYMTKEDFRVLVAIEMGMKNHDIVPTELIIILAGLRHGGVMKFISTLARAKLIAHDRSIFDGYKLTYSGYDYLALNTFLKRGSCTSVGRQIGVGKESDIFLCANEEEEVRCLKLHRLGRVSFRQIKNKRDYLQNRCVSG